MMNGERDFDNNA